MQLVRNFWEHGLHAAARIGCIVVVLLIRPDGRAGLQLLYRTLPQYCLCLTFRSPPLKCQAADSVCVHVRACGEIQTDEAKRLLISTNLTKRFLPVLRRRLIGESAERVRTNRVTAHSVRHAEMTNYGCCIDAAESSVKETPDWHASRHAPIIYGAFSSRAGTFSLPTETTGDAHRRRSVPSVDRSVCVCLDRIQRDASLDSCSRGPAPHFLSIVTVHLPPGRRSGPPALEPPSLYNNTLLMPAVGCTT